MMIKLLELKNFRNYNQLSLPFSKGTNLFYGDNAQGKTNILEAIFLCSTTKSHKSNKDKEMIQFNQEESHIKLIVEKNGIDQRIDMHLKKNKNKGVAINGVPIRKLSQLLGSINVIFFSPEDLCIIKNGPSERRRFIDLELCQLDKIYTSDLLNYNKVIQQRNKILKELDRKPDLFDTFHTWDYMLVKYGIQVIKERRNYIDHMNQILKDVHYHLSGKKEELVLYYEPNVTEDIFEEQLKRGRDKELKYRVSLIGPHRDDISFLVNGIDLRKFGSQGQQRTAALSLKLSEISLVKQAIHDDPILLLDDVLSELDGHRQLQLLDNIRDIQTLMTCTGVEEFVNHQFQIDSIYRVIQGTVIKENICS